MTRIFYLCPTEERAYGGLAQLYRHVDALVAAGHEAWIVHDRPGVRAPGTTPVLDGDALAAARCGDRDFVVVPASAAHLTPHLPGRHVLLVDDVVPALAGADPGPFRRATALVASTEHDARALAFAYPDHRVLRVRHGLAAAAGTHRRLRDRPVQIAYAALPRPLTAVTAYHMYRARAQRRGGTVVPWVRLGGLGTAATLAHAPICVLPTAEHRLARLVLEAVAAGCVVIAHDAEGVPAEWVVADHDVREIVARLEAITAAPERFQAAADRARDRVLAAYSLEREAESVRALWAALLT